MKSVDEMRQDLLLVQVVLEAQGDLTTLLSSGTP